MTNKKPKWIMSAPIMINLEIIDSCNIKCRHCYNFWREDSVKHVKKFTKDMFDKFLEMVIESGVFHVVLTGGEPFLNFEVLEYGLKRLTENGISNSVNTNLMLVTPDKIKRLRDVGLDHVLTSLNSYDPETNDYINNKKGSFDKIIKGIKVARSEGIRVSVNMIIYQRNKNHIYDTGRFLNNLGCQRLFATRIVPNVSIDSPEETEYKLEQKEAQSVLDQIIRVYTDFEINVGTLVSYPLCILGDLEKYRPLVGRGCPAQTGNRMSVNADGIAHACVHEMEGYGNIFEIGIKNAFANMKKWHDGSYLYNGCISCDYLSVCNAGCRMVAYSHSKKMNGPDNLMLGEHKIIRPIKLPLNNKMVNAVDSGEKFIVPKRIRFRKESGFYVINVRWANAFPIETKIGEFLIKAQKRGIKFDKNDFNVKNREIMINLFMKDVIESANSRISCETSAKFEGASLNPFALPV